MLSKAIIDSSSLIELEKKGILEPLSVIWSQIFYPQQVKTEVTRRGKAQVMRRKLMTFFQKCRASDVTRVELLKQLDADPGEAEVIVQATEQQIPVVIIDDKDAQKLALRHGLIVRDVNWILSELKRLELLPGRRGRI